MSEGRAGEPGSPVESRDAPADTRSGGGTPVRERGWTLVAAASVLLGAVLRARGIGAMPLFGDEYHTRYAVDDGLATILASFDAYGSHTALPLVQKLSIQLLGPGVVSMRAASLAAGVLTLGFLVPVGRRLVGSGPAAIATLALAVSPSHLFYSRFARGYALLGLLAVLLVGALQRAVSARTQSNREWPWWLGVALCAGLMPWIHLSGAGFAAAMGVAACAVVYAAGRETGTAVAGRLVRPVAAFAAGVLLCGLLVAPAWQGLQEYSVRVADNEILRPATASGIAVLLFGSSVVAVVCIVSAVATPALLFRRGRRASAAWLAAAAIGPVLLLLAARPYGTEYAWSRYLLTALPFALLAAAWGIRSAVEAASGRSVSWLAPLVSIGLLVIPVASGPLVLGDGGPPTFANSFLSLYPLPAFDTPNPAAPRLYDDLARRSDAQRILEAQPLLSRAVLLYRSHAARHGKDVVFGWFESLPASLGDDRYVDLSSAAAWNAGPDADVLVVHRDLEREVRAYWRFVEGEAERANASAIERGLWKRYRGSGIEDHSTATPQFAREIERLARHRYGEPYYEDELVWAWRLR